MEHAEVNVVQGVYNHAAHQNKSHANSNGVIGLIAVTLCVVLNILSNLGFK